jgi:hypothetical protein
MSGFDLSLKPIKDRSALQYSNTINLLAANIDKLAVKKA